MSGIFSIKIFIIIFICFLIFFMICVYKRDGSREYDEKLVIIVALGAIIFGFYLFLTVMRPEIKAFVTKLKSEKTRLRKSPL